MSAQSSAKPVTEGGRHRGRSQEVGDRRLMVTRTRMTRTTRTRMTRMARMRTTRTRGV